MNDTLCRGAWDKGCTDIMYMTIEYPNYPIIYLLTKPSGNCVTVLKRKNSSFHFRIWTRILTTTTKWVNIELRPVSYSQGIVSVNLLNCRVYKVFRAKKEEDKSIFFDQLRLSFLLCTYHPHHISILLLAQKSFKFHGKNSKFEKLKFWMSNV